MTAPSLGIAKTCSTRWSSSSAGVDLVAAHARSTEPLARVLDPAHYAGLWRVDAAAPTPSLGLLGARSR
jgi:hypothetical protein